MNNLYFCGDIHGEWKEFVFKVTQQYDLHDANIIILGDFGIGFTNDMPNLYKWAEKRLEKNNLKIWAIRGNHDDPAYFSDEDKYSYPLLRFMEDHKTYNISGRSIYSIGGASSLDIEWRLETNQKLASKGKDKRVWWEGEKVGEKYDNLPGKVDIIISHCAPLSFNPVSTRPEGLPEYQWENIMDERKYLNHVLSEVTTDYWYFGHYHNSISGSYENVIYRGLGIMEIVEAGDKNDNN